MSKCYLLGAGASYGHDDTLAHKERPPLGNSLFEAGWERGILRWNDFSALARKIADYNNAGRNLDNIKASDFRMDDTEKFLRYLNEEFKKENAEDSRENWHALSLSYYYIFELLRQQCVGYYPDRDNYAQMAEYLGRKSSSVITLNYDSLLERALESKDTSYKFEGVSRYDGVEILKLHGSINWVNKGVVTVTDADSFKYEVQNTHSNSIRAPIRYLSDYWLDNHTYRSLVYDFEDTHEPTLIPPFDEYKDYSKMQTYGKIWNWAKSTLSEASEVVIIGCSLNMADSELRTLLKNNIDANTEFTIVTPNTQNIADKLEIIFENPTIAQKIGGKEPFSEYAEMVFEK